MGKTVLVPGHGCWEHLHFIFMQFPAFVLRQSTFFQTLSGISAFLLCVCVWFFLTHTHKEWVNFDLSRAGPSSSPLAVDAAERKNKDWWDIRPRDSSRNKVLDMWRKELRRKVRTKDKDRWTREGRKQSKCTKQKDKIKENTNKAKKEGHKSSFWFAVSLHTVLHLLNRNAF